MESLYESYFEMLPGLRTRFLDASIRYTSLRGRVRPSITRWEWSSYPRYILEPFGMWILGHPQPGRLIKSEPTSKNGKYRHGYDAQDFMVLTEAHTEFEGRFYESYLEYFDDRIESTHYSYSLDKECINVETLLVESGQPIAFLRYAVEGRTAVVYEYDGGRITRFGNCSQSHTGQHLADRLMVQRGTVIYNAKSVERIEFEWDSGEKEAILSDGRRRSLPRANETAHVATPPALPTIKPRYAKKQFLLALENAGHQLATLTLEHGMTVMLDFYRNQRATGCSLGEDGDMLLFQSGFLSVGKQELFYIDITRQLTHTDNGVDDVIRQLSLRFQFPVEEGLRAIPESNRWCITPNELDLFRTFVHDCDAWREVASAKPVKVDLSFGEV